MPFAVAVEAVRAGSVFTTHTPVSAGIDQFDRGLFEKYFTSFAAECGATLDELFASVATPARRRRDQRRSTWR